MHISLNLYTVYIRCIKKNSQHYWLQLDWVYSGVNKRSAVNYSYFFNLW